MICNLVLKLASYNKITYLPAPFSIPAHFFRNQEVVGVFVANVNVLFVNAKSHENIDIIQDIEYHLNVLPCNLTGIGISFS